MKTLIVYATTHGCTGKVASELKEQIGAGTDICNLKNETIPCLAQYGRVIIGGSIHAGKIQKRVKDFCASNLDVLLKCEVGLFICCLEEGEVARRQLNNSFPPELMQHAKSSAVLGGSINFDKMNFIERLIIKKGAKIEESVSRVNHDAVTRFAVNMDKVFNPFLFLV